MACNDVLISGAGISGQFTRADAIELPAYPIDAARAAGRRFEPAV